MIKKVAFFAYPAKDTKRAGKFYKEVLGLGADSYYEDIWAEVEVADGSTVAFDREAAGPYLALETDDIKAEIARLQGLGVEIVKEPFDTGVCQMALIRDSEGNVVMLHQIHPDRA